MAKRVARPPPGGDRLGCAGLPKARAGCRQGRLKCRRSPAMALASFRRFVYFGALWRNGSCNLDSWVWQSCGFFKIQAQATLNQNPPGDNLKKQQDQSSTSSQPFQTPALGSKPADVCQNEGISTEQGLTKPKHQNDGRHVECLCAQE